MTEVAPMLTYIYYVYSHSIDNDTIVPGKRLLSISKSGFEVMVCFFIATTFCTGFHTAINYYHKALHLGCFSSPRSASVSHCASLRIQFECRKIRTRITPNADTLTQCLLKAHSQIWDYFQVKALWKWRIMFF